MPLPKSARSHSATRSPRSAASRAIPQPMMPPPITTTSNVSEEMEESRSLALASEVTEITERIDNALIVTEDTYLARIFGSAIDLFRVRAWNAAVERKLAIMRDTYTALYDDAATARSELLEVAIVLLIVFEIVMALLGL